MTTDRPKLSLPGHSGAHDVKITVYAAVPYGEGQAILLHWEEPGDAFEQEVEQVGSPLLMDYGLDDPPGFGIWAFEGELKITWGRCGHPLDPPDYDYDMHWEGEWRSPTDEEMLRWRGRKAKHTTYEQSDE